AAVPRVPAPALRRHAPARDDRDRARGQAAAAHRRRGHHRAGRDHAGADHGAAGRAPAAAGHGRHPDQPRPRARRQLRRRRRRDVRRAGRGAGVGGCAVLLGPDALHARPAGCDPAAGTPVARGAAGGAGAAARPGRAAVRVLVPPAVRLGHRPVRDPAAVRRARAGPLVGLLAPRRAAERAGGEGMSPGMSAVKDPLLQARNIVQEFPVRGAGGLRGGVVHAVSDVSFDLYPGETLGVVGETGSGKSTLARSLVQAPRPKSGQVLFQGTDLVQLRGKRLVAARRHVQMVYQDPFGSLNPRWRVSELVEEPLVGYGVKGAERRRRRVGELLDLVGLDPSVYGQRRPRELSGGQCQRVAIARAIALDPALVICDEAVSSLDVLIQAQVLNLFERLRAELGLSYVFIAHDLALVKQVSDRVAVMHLGQLAEVGPAEALYRSPLHPYTSALLDSVP